MNKHGIEWTEKTWNPTTGCTMFKIECVHCYALRMSMRLQAMGQKKYKDGFKIRTHPHALDLPYTWKKPQLVFVNSMSDLFHKNIPLHFIQQVFEVMNKTPQHTYQVLTKRSDILLRYSPLLNWTPNIWMGVSVGYEGTVHRIDDLRKTGAAIKFLSLEPLLGPLPNLNLNGIDWVIVGGESGPKARPMKEEWVEDILGQCQKAGVKFFFKQWGGVQKKKTGRLLLGRTWDDMPTRAEMID